jgi:hypothetical protein
MAILASCANAQCNDTPHDSAVLAVAIIITVVALMVGTFIWLTIRRRPYEK